MPSTEPTEPTEPTVPAVPAVPAVLAVPAEMLPFLAVGTMAIVAGGVVAAVTGPAGWEDGSWVAAFLVLVAGVGQIGLGAGQAILATAPLPRRRIVGELAALNAGSGLVVLATLSSMPALVTLGGLILVGALVVFAGAGLGDRPTRHRARPVYLVLIGVLVVSTPIGLVLAWLRA